MGRWSRARTVRWAVVLPCLGVALWLATVALPAAQLFLQLRAASGRAGQPAAVAAPLATANSNVTWAGHRTTVAPAEFAPIALNLAVLTHSHAITALQMPGALVAMPVDVALRRPSEWFPRQLNLWTWRAFTPAVDCIPFWWMVGAALEALCLRRRLGWLVALLGSLTDLALLLLLAGALAGSSDGSAPGWALAGLILWTALLAIVPVAWLRQRRT